MISFEIKGLKETHEMLQNKKRQIDQNAHVGINRATLFMQGEVVLSIAGQRNEPRSVDSGRFMSSIDVTTLGDSGWVFTDVEYAKILEFGGVNRQPRSHFRNSVARNKQEVKEIIAEEIKKL
jgi:HK97 gp10 family phage protein